MSRFFWQNSIAFLMAGVVVAAFSAQADDTSHHLSFLKKLSGTWKGRGQLRRSLSANKEPVSCRLDDTLENGKLSMAYICLGIDVRFESTGSIFYEPATNGYAGTWYTTGQNWKARVQGSKSGNGIKLILNGQHPKTGKPLQSHLDISLNAAGELVNIVRARDPETGEQFEVFAVTFKR